MGLAPVAVAVDDAGMQPNALDRALRDGAAAVVCTPRAQNPTGAALDRARVTELNRVLRRHPEVLVVEDDHAGDVAGAVAHTLSSARRERWAVVRSVAKSLGPDLRVALVTADPTTVGRLRGRQGVGPGWVSHMLQRTVAGVWSAPGTDRLLASAAAAYADRRRALVDALAAEGITAHGRSGLNVWVPVRDESEAVGALLAAGIAVAPGTRFRLRSGPAIRITAAALDPATAASVAQVLGNLEDHANRATRAG
jgi:DNA-binding transcriptional MocR family regulator